MKRGASRANQRGWAYLPCSLRPSSVKRRRFSRSEKRRRTAFTLAACALTMPIRACRFPASISSWLKSLPVGCGSPQAAQQPASRHWAGELRGCSSINFPREEASGGLSLFGTPSNAATAGLIAGVPHEAARRNLLAQVRKSGGLNLHNFGMPFVQTFGAPLGPEDRPYAPDIHRGGLLRLGSI